MERVKIGFVLSLVVLFMAINSGSSLKCYVCQSGTNPSCADPYKVDDRHLQDCTTDISRNGNVDVANLLKKYGVVNGLDSIIPPVQLPFNVPMVCSKLVLKSNNDKVTIRTCQMDNVEDKSTCKGYAHLAGKELVSNCEICNKDACNGVGYAKAPALLGLVVMVSSVFLLTRA